MIIALTGPAGCGKSTIANALVRDHGFVRVRFADTLKAMLRTFGLTEAQVDGGEKEIPLALLGGKTPRHAMQTLGTQWGRQHIGQDVWVDATMRTVDTLIAAHRNVVVDDLRFDNEARALTSRSACILLVLRDCATTAHSSHASEQGIAPAWLSGRVDNNCTLTDTMRTVSNIMLARAAQGRADI